MIAVTTDSFVFGVDNYPDWFKRMNIDGKIIWVSTDPLAIEIENNKVLRAVKGDVIMKIGDSAVVVPKDAAKKYM